MSEREKPEALAYAERSIAAVQAELDKGRDCDDAVLQRHNNVLHVCFGILNIPNNPKVEGEQVLSRFFVDRYQEYLSYTRNEEGSHQPAAA